MNPRDPPQLPAAAGLGGGDAADVVIVNTCAVTGEAERQARQAIRRLKRERPQARIGRPPGAQRRPAPTALPPCRKSIAVVGNDAKMRIDAWTQAQDIFARVTRFRSRSHEKIAVNDIMSVRELRLTWSRVSRGAPAPTSRCRTAATIAARFCIIPYGRGNSRSVPMGEVVEEVAPPRQQRIS